MTIPEALRRGITAVTHPTWKLGHLHIERFGNGIIIHGQTNADGKQSWLRRPYDHTDGKPSWHEYDDDYTGHDGYMEYRHEDETV